MNSEVDDPDLDIKKIPCRYRLFWAAAYFLLVTVLSFAVLIPEQLIRTPIEFVEPTFFDPHYENANKIKQGMAPEEVHELLGGAPQEIRYCRHGCSHWETWTGTRGTIVVTFIYPPNPDGRDRNAPMANDFEIRKVQN
jgi:hypothetical protein